MADSVRAPTVTVVLRSLVCALARPLQRYHRAQAAHGRLLVAALLVYAAVASAWLLDHHTWPSPDLVALGLFGFALLLARPLSFVCDWAPFVILVHGYVALAGIDPGVVGRAHIQFPIDADHWLTFGRIPRLSLQAHLWHVANPRWYDYLSALLDPMHFIVPFVLACVLWLRQKRNYWRFVLAYILACYAGLAVYLLYPMAPPWWAPYLHRIPPVASIQTELHYGAKPISIVLLTRYFVFNPVAAMPSIHAACSLLAGLVMCRVWPRWGWTGMIYALAMAFAVIYTGQHYFVDVLAGWLDATGAFIIAWIVVPDFIRHLPQALPDR